MITVDTVIDWIQLFNTKNIGLKSFWTLINLYKTAKNALQHIAIPSNRQDAENIWRKSGGNILIAFDDRYPRRLKNYITPPPIIYYSGNCELLNDNLVAIIGARNASLTGRNIAERFAESLSGYFTITSGMARGIDTCALTGAIHCGKAVAVLPFGLDNIYPHENMKLFRKICDNGVAITEVPPNRSPDQGMFFARNKLLSMLTSGIIVIEAALKSGTMNTVEMALDMGCEVMVVPGSPLDARSFGSNLLIKNGANLVQTASDVLDILKGSGFVKSNPILKVAVQKNLSSDSNDANISRILTQLSSVPVSIDTLSNITKIEIPQLLSFISQLEIAGKIAKTHNNEIVLL